MNNNNDNTNVKFLTYTYNNEEKIGVLSADETKVVDLEKLLNLHKNYTMNEFIENYSTEFQQKIITALKENTGLDLEGLKIEAPIPIPNRGIICLGKNYKDHVKEVPSTMDFKGGIPEDPIFFCKFLDRAVAHNDFIPPYDNITNQLDYEVELAIIIGKKGKNIPIEKVEEFIFGYTILNDISIRNLQSKHVQWFKGKSLDGTCPMGPYITLKSSITFPPKLNIKCYVNDELRQNSNTKELIFDIPYIISEFSKGTTLKPGDIISTGTPSGVGMGFSPKKFLKKNDKVTCVIEKIGTLCNKVMNP